MLLQLVCFPDSALRFLFQILDIEMCPRKMSNSEKILQCLVLCQDLHRPSAAKRLQLLGRGRIEVLRLHARCAAAPDMSYVGFKANQAASCRKEIEHIKTHSMFKVMKLYEATPLQLHHMKSTANFTVSQQTLAIPEAKYLHSSPPASEVYLHTHSAHCTNQPDLTLRTHLQ